MPFVAVYPDGCSRHVTLDEIGPLRQSRPDVRFHQVWSPVVKSKAKVLIEEKKPRPVNFRATLTPEQTQALIADVMATGYEQAARKWHVSKGTVLKVCRLNGARKRKPHA